MNSVAVRGRILLVDSFTVTAADTPRNQAEYPQNPAQQRRHWFPDSARRHTDLVDDGDAVRL